MTTPPKAKKFRLRRDASLAGGRRPPAPAEEEAAPGGLTESGAMFDTGEDGFGDAPFATARSGPPSGPSSGPSSGAARPAAPSAAPSAAPPEGGAATEIEAIRREGLTGRQLRMARRVAQKNGLNPASDYDAVRLLRQQGIDPFERSTMLELVIADGKPAGEVPPHRPGTALTRAPQTLPQKPGKGPEPLSAETRAREILRIQRDIVRRRRRKLGMLFVRLAIFVLLPTLMAGWYYFRIATPLYATKSEFLIQKADSPSGSIGSLFAGTQFAASQDSITVQSFLTSRDAMLRLDREEGFKAHFSQEFIDPVKRLPPDATNEDTYKLYQQYVKIGFDPTEGVVRMEVTAADPASSEKFSQALIRFAEEQVDHLSARLREDQMTGAQRSYEDAERKVQAAQERVLELQEKLGVLDPMAESGSLMTQITGLESQLQQKRLELQALLDNAQPNQARVDGVRGDIGRLETLIGNLRAQMTQTVGDNASLARISGELRMAEADLLTRQTMLAAAMEQLETARIEANKQVRYLAVGVRPVAPDRPTYPRRFEDTLLAFLIFSGIYLMLSLTASILREQVSS